MLTVLRAAAVLSVLSGQGSDAFDCCTGYTDALGDYHQSQLCTDYCCWTLGVAYKGCCSTRLRKIPVPVILDGLCILQWISEHTWVPMLIGFCTFCWFCGCCGCVLRNLFRYTNTPPSSTAVTTSSNNQFLDDSLIKLNEDLSEK
ncbi:uncharacterized protein LOC128557488 [Mercenaria mercenaria]|uniref:uncharacterized protein LOC128557488 n=1 Tax=Mercenaria mercenaria TaxID=6596 RepID=UPI00234E797A|nr:uncharacterized protein LOC128557488 [Mercenaria mercenaria]